ncbi:FAD-dependent monooxygenase [Lentzea jiangxiensis]|uniref:2,4-dichlorophenol 6-monooxygenase n=1 Tax=Lentzea jiangxiensis TaxID=641025 RepID=A0A1H0X4K4_9PSEU|nr:FAD-dependent monooxygenase [Lentzea jiangxiensis]SDP97416.1 2,4-dichlorophenol 6-monooxygenase [Lentzea jiangxiensis]
MHTSFRLGNADRDDRDAILGRVRRMLGIPDLEIEVHAVSRGVVARRQRLGRVFLVGNAAHRHPPTGTRPPAPAHRHPPTGGLGLNTAVQDVHNLVWKLDAVLPGQSAEALLDSYEAERRPVGEFTVEHCLTDTRGHARVGAALGLHAGQPEDEGWEAIGKWLADTPEGEAKRAAVAEAIGSNADDFGQLAVELGYHYETGAIVPDGTPAPVGANPLRSYVPTTRPGHHLPHVRLDHGGAPASVHHLVAPRGLTLLIDAEHAERWAEAARSADVTAVVRVCAIGQGAEWTAPEGEWAAVRGVGSSGAVLVRPDRHVAWRVPARCDDSPAALRQAVTSVLALSPEHAPAVRREPAVRASAGGSSW